MTALVVLVVAVAGIAYVVFGRGGGSSDGSAPSATPSAKVVERFAIRSAGYALPAPVQREVAVLDGRRIVLAGGLDQQGGSAEGVFAMNPASGHLSALGTVPQPFHDAAGAMIGHRLFVFGGGVGSSTATVQAFDVSTRKGSVVGRLPVPLSDLGAATVGSTVYLVGGYDGRTPQAAIYATSDGTSFRRVGALPVGLRYPAVTAIGDQVVIAGGQTASGPTDAVEVFTPSTGKVTALGRLPYPVAHASAIAVGGRVYVVGGDGSSGRPLATVVEVSPATGSAATVVTLTHPLADAGAVSAPGQAWLVGGSRGARTLGQVLRATVRRVTVEPAPSDAPSPTGSPGSTQALEAVRPFAGLLVVADRGSNHILVLNAQKQIVWKYPSKNLPRPPYKLYFPDDTFWVHGGHAILVNEEDNDTLIEIAYPSGKVLWSYGHPGQPGSAPGYLHQPDDAYPTRSGGLTVADALNCRILFFNRAGRPVHQIGQTGNCTPNLPVSIGYPNADTPLANGNYLTSQINGALIDEVTRSGRVVWQVHLPNVSYPSDPQPLPGGSGYVVADFAKPGRVVAFTRTGRILWTFGSRSGPKMLDHPSLAAPLPNGLVAVNDDYNDRVLIFDPKTRQIVWQYGVQGRPGSRPGYLNIPDGLDLLLPNGTVPLHIDFPSTQVTPGRP